MRHLAILALSATLLAGGCAAPDGSLDPGRTLALTGGLAALGGLAYMASQDDDRRYYRRGHGGHRRHAAPHGGWHGRGGHRGWR